MRWGVSRLVDSAARCPCCTHLPPPNPIPLHDTQQNNQPCPLKRRPRHGSILADAASSKTCTRRVCFARCFARAAWFASPTERGCHRVRPGTLYGTPREKQPSMWSTPRPFLRVSAVHHSTGQTIQCVGSFPSPRQNSITQARPNTLGR